MGRLRVAFDRLLAGGLGVAGFFFLRAGLRFWQSPAAHGNALVLPASSLGLLGLLRWVSAYSLVEDARSVTLACGGVVDADHLPPASIKIEPKCSKGCVHDRAEIGAALSQTRARLPESQAWLTAAACLGALGFGGAFAALFHFGQLGAGVIVALLLAVVVALKSRSKGAMMGLAFLAILAILWVCRDAIDFDDWGELIVIALCLPFSLLNKGDDDD